jgi:hypothetical protein
MVDVPNTELLNPFPDLDGSRKDREDRIRQRAFDLWQAEGMPEGREHEHWLAAEREFMMAESEPSLGTPMVPGEDIPPIRSASAGGPRPGGDGTGNDPSDKAIAPKTSGAATPGPDTSKNPVANRNTSGPRKAGATPRPTGKPLG